MLNKDFSDMLSALSEAKADFLVVGAYALASYGLVRATGDLDIWVRPTERNASRVWEALCHTAMAHFTRKALLRAWAVLEHMIISLASYPIWRPAKACASVTPAAFYSCS